MMLHQGDLSPHAVAMLAFRCDSGGIAEAWMCSPLEATIRFVAGTRIGPHVEILGLSVD
jgi:hypothetical protein